MHCSNENWGWGNDVSFSNCDILAETIVTLVIPIRVPTKKLSGTADIQPVSDCWFSRAKQRKLSSDQHIGSNIPVKYELSRSQSKDWLNQGPRRGCVFTQTWFPPSNSPFSASPGQENNQDCGKIISNLIPKQNSAWKVQISRGDPCESLPRYMRKMRPWMQLHLNSI